MNFLLKVIFVFLLILFVGILVYMLRPLTAPEDYYRSHFEDLARAKLSAREEASIISYSGEKIFEKGLDEGCSVTGDGFFSDLRSVNCSYVYAIVYRSSSNNLSEANKYYNFLRKKNWIHDSSPNYDPRFDQGVRSVNLRKNGVTDMDPLFEMSLYEYKDKGSVFGWPYNKLASHYLTNDNSYIYGSTLRYIYFHIMCHHCANGNSVIQEDK